MITVSELIEKLSLCPSAAVVVYADHPEAEQACSISADVYGEATATPTDTGVQRQVVILLPDVPSELAQQLASSLERLAAVTEERDRWIARNHRLEQRLSCVRDALEV